MLKPLFYLFVFVACVSCQRPPGTAQAMPESITYLPRDAWGAKPAVLPMRAHKLTRLTLHHTATKQNPAKSIKEKMQGLQAFSQREDKLADGRTKQAWADIPYHLYVDVHGHVAEGRDLSFAGDSNTAYDPAGHLLIVVEGNFEQEELTPQQLRTLKVLVPALAKKYKIPAANLGAHKDFAQTQCPGAKLYAQLPYFAQLIKGK